MDFGYTEPLTLAEMARCALSAAHVASVASVASPGSMDPTTVKVAADRYGRPILYLSPQSPLIARVESERLLTLTVAASEPFEALEIRGPVMRVKAGPGERCLAYRMALLSVCFVRPRVAPVRLAAYHAAQPDDLWGERDEMLAHLSQQHSAELTACVRAHGIPEASVVVARSIDRRGLELAVLTEDGVSAVWMPFLNGPVTSSTELACQLKLCLTCRCRNHAPRSGHEPDAC